LPNAILIEPMEVGDGLLNVVNVSRSATPTNGSVTKRVVGLSQYSIKRQSAE
jgi:hypothetical protein